jgi:hypothetical protein
MPKLTIRSVEFEAGIRVVFIPHFNFRGLFMPQEDFNPTWVENRVGLRL